ncbi:hypothetical protein C2E23DRAFT_864128 [Lenzites betulinus]|nr:hypothetical protein C2E23DRAFT_864128 [Lenzites betulinus]
MADTDATPRSTYEKLTLRNVFYATISGGERISQWLQVTVVITETYPAPQGRSQWTLHIYPPIDHFPVSIDMASNNWTLHWEEKLSMVFYRTGGSEPDSFRHCLIIYDKRDFMRLVTLCSNAHILQYIAFPVAMPNV